MLTLVAEDDVAIRPIAPALDRNIRFDPGDRFLSLVRYVAPDISPWLETVRQAVPGIGEARVILVSDQSTLERALPQADVVITESLTIDSAGLDRAPRLCLVQKFGTNLVNVDVAACHARGVAVRPLRRVQNIAVAEHALALIMALAKRLTYVNGLVTERRLSEAGVAWNKIDGLANLRGSVLGLLGFGEISRELAAMARGLGLTILYGQRNRADQAIEKELAATYVPLAELLSRADFLSIHIPLNAGTWHLLDAKALAHVKTGLRLVNTSRADIIEPNALLEALRSGRIESAAFDVHYAEPVRDDDPFFALENVLLTPHVAGATRVNLLTDVMNLALSVQEGLSSK